MGNYFLDIEYVQEVVNIFSSRLLYEPVCPSFTHSLSQSVSI